MKGHQLLDQLLPGRLFREIDEHGSRVAVEDRHAHALAGDLRGIRHDDLPVLHMSKDAQGLLFTLLLLAADVGDDIAHHLRPVLKCLARAGDCLVGRHHKLHRLKLLPRSQAGGVALDRAVRLDRDEAALCAKPLLLVFDHLEVVLR